MSEILKCGKCRGAQVAPRGYKHMVDCKVTCRRCGAIIPVNPITTTQPLAEGYVMYQPIGVDKPIVVPDYVAKAEGAIDIFADSGDNGKGNPTTYGVIVSGAMIMGGTYLNEDKRGVVNLVQTWVS